MASACDICGNEPGRWLMHDTDTGDVRGLGADCLPMIGIGLLMQQDPALIDGTLKEFGYQPTKALKDARKAAELPEVDPARIIARVEIPVDPPTDPESTSQQDDEPTQPPTDLSTIPPRADEVESAAEIGEAFASAMASEPVEPVNPVPPY